MPQIWQDPTLLFRTSLISDVVLLACFGAGFPWALIKIFDGIRYLDGLAKVKWVMIGGCWAMGFLVLIDLINNLLGNILPSEIWVKAASAVSMFFLCIVVHLKWPWLNTLYPQETLIAERKRNAQLIIKMRIWDDTTPCAKIESRNGKLIDANLAAMKLSGYSRQELLHGIEPVNLLHPDDRHYYYEVVLQHKTTTYEARIIHKSGRIIPCEIHAAEAPYEEGLRLTFITDQTRYVDERDRRIREERAHRCHENFKAAAQDLMDTARQM